MKTDTKNLPWNKDKVAKELEEAFDNNSEEHLLSILKNNSFLFYELFSRKGGVQPIFHEVSFGGRLRCDFTWLNDNSDGPEWVLVEVERPRLKPFKRNGKPTQELNDAIEQVKSWKSYLNRYPDLQREIFGAVASFRYVLIAGSKENWENENAAKWRVDNNQHYPIEIRTSDIFLRALKLLEEWPTEFWSFAEKPKTLSPSELKHFWENYSYMDKWRKMFS